MRRHLSGGLGLAFLLCLGSAFLPSCLLSSSEGTNVRLTVEGIMASAISADGISVALDEVFVHIESAELVICDETTEARVWLGPSVARAHHGSAEGTVLTTPHLVALHGPAVDFGSFRPPPGRYCAVHFTLTPAVARTDGVTEAMVGWSLFGHGTLGGPPRDVYGYGVVHWELPLTAPIALEEGQLAAMLDVQLDLGATIGDLNADDAELFGGEVLRALPERAVARETSPE